MQFDPSDPPDELSRFLTERHLATLTVVRPDGSPHVSPVGVTWDPDAVRARVITRSGSVKAKLIAASPGTPVAVCQVDGGRWLALHGPATVTADPLAVRAAEARYEARYRRPTPRPDRVVIEIAVDRIVGRL